MGDWSISLPDFVISSESSLGCRQPDSDQVMRVERLGPQFPFTRTGTAASRAPRRGRPGCRPSRRDAIVKRVELPDVALRKSAPLIRIVPARAHRTS
jgi:hypothetical protein